MNLVNLSILPLFMNPVPTLSDLVDMSEKKIKEKT